MSFTIEVVEPGTYCLMGWTGTVSGFHDAWGGCVCYRPEGHDGRHQCDCGSWRHRRDDDPTWEDET